MYTDPKMDIQTKRIKSLCTQTHCAYGFIKLDITCKSLCSLLSALHVHTLEVSSWSLTSTALDNNPKPELHSLFSQNHIHLN